MPAHEDSEIAGVVLAGGRSRRMGGADKALVRFGGETLLGRAIRRATAQVGPLVISTNGDVVAFAAHGLPLLPDPIAGFAGPLAGILAGLEWTILHAPHCRWLASFAVDAPLFPDDLVKRLLTATGSGGADITCAASAGRRHPVFALWPLELAAPLRRALTIDRIHKVRNWTDRYRVVEVEWPSGPPDPFHNINTPEDLKRLTRISHIESDMVIHDG
ncbi:MAG: molybdenum cofactor guanylyltransferase MobA [Rhodospirillaceae bacterium]